MSGNFWAQRLGTAPAQTPAPAAPQPAAASQPWWAVPRPQPQVPAPQQAPVALQEPLQQQPQFEQNGEVPIEVLLANPNYHTTKPPMSERLADNCPDCGSGNYMNIAGRENRARRCFDCGYNPMFAHSTAGISATNKDIPVYTARSQTGNTNNYNPQQIVGKV